MQLAMIGLGRMGGNMVQRLLQGGHQVVVFDRSADAVKAHVGMGATRREGPGRPLSASSSAPRVVWVMVPAGAPVESTIDAAAPGALAQGTSSSTAATRTSRTRCAAPRRLKEQGLEFIDAGTSGGIWGLTVGYCLMIGASPEAFKRCEPIFRTLAPPDGYAHVGPPGAGHYVKMIHNGIEYGMLQAYAEGYEILHASKDFKLDLQQISAVWNRGSVVRSWLNELAERAFAKDADLPRSRATSRTRAKAAGRCRRRSTSTCRRRSSRSRC